ncbi:MAG TPA: hypothetical protein VFR31_17370 [Thermoanaerobaculia bacterium]|nr:hypothetical protein [Thermoanaerobaculia bacterium]
MSDVQRRGMILMVIGALCVLFGIFLYSQRVGLAEVVLGAHFWFGIPVSSADSLKLLVTGIGTSALTLKGFVIGAVGLVLFSKNGAVTSDRTATPTPR